MGTSNAWQNITISGKTIVDLAMSGGLNARRITPRVRTSSDAAETSLLRAAERARAVYGLEPFTEHPGDYHKALELVKKGRPADVAVALYSPPIIDDFGIGSIDGVVNPLEIPAVTSEDDNGHHDSNVKPSRNLKDRLKVNHHLRIPDYKRRPHKDPKKPIGGWTQIQYGKFTTLVDISRATDFLSMVFGQRSRYDDGDIGAMMKERHNFFEVNYGDSVGIEMLSPSTYKGVSRDRAVGTRISRPQYTAFLNLLKGLRTPNNQEGRHGRVLKLYERLARYPTSFLPIRSMHDNLMDSLYAAVAQNLRVEVTFTLPHHVGHRVEIGYEILPYGEPDRKAKIREEVIEENNGPRFINHPVQTKVVYGNGHHRPSETRIYTTHSPHPRLQRAMTQFSR